MPSKSRIISALEQDPQLYDFATDLLSKVNFYAFVTPKGKGRTDPSETKNLQEHKEVLLETFKAKKIYFKNDREMISTLRKIIPNEDVLQKYNVNYH